MSLSNTTGRPHNPVSVRSMQAADIALIVGWMQQVPLWQRYGFAAEKATARFSRALAQADLMLVADLPALPACGFAWVVADGAFARSPYLRQIGVHPDHTGAGVGAALLAAAEAAARTHSGDLFLLASDFNKAAHRFYRRHGYAHIGTIPGYVLPDVDEYIFWKRLD
ncbi:MAG TPA: GNAT family N-acetyltransferase [Spirillospora sp.]|nr:GNAT family N-acetyltransferase [Spirillospora sp.]